MTVKKVIKKKVIPVAKEPEQKWYDNDADEHFVYINKPFIDDCFTGSFDLMFKSKRISANISELPHCCGVCELGDLGIDESFPQEAFNELMNGLCTKGFTLCVNTVITSQGNRTWASLLEKCPSFIEVKSFVNPNTKHEIRMWISNN